MNELSTDTLSRAATELQARIATRQSGIRELTLALERDQRELALIAELLRLRGHPAMSTGASVDEAARLRAAHGARNGNNALVEAVTSILAEAGRPLHIQELTAAVKDRGVSIPGKGSIANVISVIRNRPEISRPQRGLYTLTEWGASGRTISLRRVRPTRRVKRAHRKPSAANVRQRSSLA